MRTTTAEMWQCYWNESTNYARESCYASDVRALQGSILERNVLEESEFYAYKMSSEEADAAREDLEAQRAGLSGELLEGFEAVYGSGYIRKPVYRCFTGHQRRRAVFLVLAGEREWSELNKLTLRVYDTGISEAEIARLQMLENNMSSMGSVMSSPGDLWRSAWNVRRLNSFGSDDYLVELRKVMARVSADKYGPLVLLSEEFSRLGELLKLEPEEGSDEIRISSIKPQRLPLEVWGRSSPTRHEVWSKRKGRDAPLLESEDAVIKVLRDSTVRDADRPQSMSYAKLTEIIGDYENRVPEPCKLLLGVRNNDEDSVRRWLNEQL